MKCAAGVGGDGDRIGGERVGCPSESWANPTSQTLPLVPGTFSPLLVPLAVTLKTAETKDVTLRLTF